MTTQIHRISDPETTLNDCPPGLFEFNGTLGFKSEYGRNNGQCDAYCVESGEYFWGGADGDIVRRGNLIVRPFTLTATPPTEQATEGGVTTERDVRCHVAAVAQEETPRTDAVYNIHHLVTVSTMADFARQLERELNEAKAEAESSSRVVIATRQLATDSMDEIREIVGAPKSSDDKSKKRAADYVRELRQSIARLTEERDQARQDLEERCAENDRERAAHLQAYQEACKERDEARASRDVNLRHCVEAKQERDRNLSLYQKAESDHDKTIAKLTAAESELAELRKDRERLGGNSRLVWRSNKFLREAFVETIAGLKEKLNTRYYTLFDKPQQSSAHLSWMLSELERHLDDFPADKTGRWIGYVQGCLACNDLLNVDEERDRTRPLFRKAYAIDAARNQQEKKE